MGSNKEKPYDKYLDWNKYVRVLKLSRTPGKEEFAKVAKIVVASIVLCGLIGYIIFLLMGFIPM